MSYSKSVVIGIISIPLVCLFTIVMKILPSDLLYHFQNQAVSDVSTFLINISNFILFSQEQILTWIIWYVCGVITGLTARGVLKGILSAFSIPIIWAVLYWALFIFLSIEVPVNTWGIINELYYLTDVVIKFGMISAIGGALGGAATRQR